MSPLDAEREGPYALHLDIEPTYGFVKSVTGGSPRTNIALRMDLGTNFLRKRPVSRSYESFHVEAGMGAPLSVLRWISATLESGLVTRSGEVHTCDIEDKSLWVNHFYDAHIREITFPRLDAYSSEATFLSMSFHPIGVRLQMGRGKEIPAKSPLQKKRIIRSQFRAKMGKLPTQGLRRVEEIKWSLALTEDEVKSEQFPSANPIEWTDVSNIRLVLAGVQSGKEWLEWYNLAAMGVAPEFDGEVEWMSADRSTVLARIDLLGCGPLSFDGLPSEATQLEEQVFAFELYANSLRFTTNE